MSRLTRRLFCTAAVGVPLLLWAQEKADLEVVNHIKAEAFNSSKVMDHVFYLTDVHGPRLTNSPGYRAAAEWAVKQLQEYGLANAHLEKWGPFGQSWTYTRFSAHLIEPQYAPLIGFPLAWTPGTNGPLRGEPVLAVLSRDGNGWDRFKGKLRGKIVLVDEPREVKTLNEALARRYSENDLSNTATAPDPGASTFGPQRPPGAPLGDRPANPEAARRQAEQQRNRRAQFLKDEGALLVLTTGQRGDGGTVFAAAGGSRNANDPLMPPSVALTSEHYNRIVRLLQHKVPVKLEFEIQAQMLPESEPVNVIAEIPGGAKKDELVMLGAHLDSWHGGTGATDNAAGCAVAMEAVRIIKALGVTPERTIRIALWGGEEQGLLGSRAYVKEHFADRETMALKPEHRSVAGYFNLDNGTGKVRGIYLQGNDMMRPIAEAWLAPFRDLGANTVSIRNTGGTDHLSFDAVGLPGFQFIQDPVEYETRSHHSNMDTYDRIQRGDLMQASAIMATFVYNTAMRDQMLPRKPLPKPEPRRNESPSSDQQDRRSTPAPVTDSARQ